MRKTAILLIVASLLLSACSKAPAGARRVPVASEVPVAFAVDGPQTRSQAPLTTLAALAAQDFSVSAWYSPEGEIFDGEHSVKYFANHRFGYIKGASEDDSYANHAWQGVSRSPTSVLSPNLVYWPLDGSLSFFCYAPYREGDTDIVLEDPVTDAGVIARLPDYLPGSPLIRVTPAETAAGQADFLCAPPLLDRDRIDEGGAFPLDFSKHRMTQVEFGFNYIGTLVDDDVLNIHEKVRVTSVEIQQVIGSRYFYFKESPSNGVDGAWSELVSPSDPSGADFPKASYRISTAGGELKTGLDANLPEQGSGTYLTVRKEDTLDGVFCLLPQTVPAGASLVVSYNIVDDYAGVRGSEVITVPLCSDPPTDHPTLAVWPAGKKVRYLITLDIPNRGFVSMTAKYYDWNDANNPHPGQELMY